MHLKNWSLIYFDRRTPALSPAYDLLSTIPYIRDTDAARNFTRTKRMTALSKDELSHLAAKAVLPEKLALDTAAETVARFKDIWAKEKTNLPRARNVIDAVEAHAPAVSIYREL